MAGPVHSVGYGVAQRGALEPLGSRYDEVAESLYVPGTGADPAAAAEEITRILTLHVGASPVLRVRFCRGMSR